MMLSGLAVMLALGACKPDPAPGEPNAVSGSSMPNRVAGTSDAPDPPLVEIFGRALTLEEFERRMQLLSTTGQLLLNTPQNRGRALEMLIMLEVLAARAVEQGLAGDPLEDLLADDAVARTVLRDISSREINRGLLEEDELRRWWSMHRAEFDRQARSRLSTVVVASRPEAEAVHAWIASMLEDGREGAEWVVRRAVAEWSIDPTTRAVEGALGYVSPPESGGNVNPEIARVAFALDEPGLAEEVVQTERGWEVIYVSDVISAIERPFEEIEDTLRDRVYAERVAEVQRGYLDALLAESDLTLDATVVEDLRAAYLEQGGPASAVRPRRYSAAGIAGGADVILGLDGVADVEEEILGWTHVDIAAPGPAVIAEGSGLGEDGGGGEGGGRTGATP